MRCVRCGRVILREPAAMVGARAVGPKCAEAMGLVQRQVRPAGRSLRQRVRRVVVLPVAGFTPDLFEMLEGVSHG